MTSKIKNIAVIAVFLLTVSTLSLLGLAREPVVVSDTERRPLAQLPEFSREELLNGRYFSRLETYTVDQYPFRDGFRKFKAFVNSKIFNRGDNNGYYQSEGYLSKLDYPLNEASVAHAADRMQYIYDTYLKGGNHNIIYSVIPDKNYFLAEKSGYPSLNYHALVGQLQEELGQNMTYVDIFDALQIEDYYKTDTHWRQECLSEVVDRLAAALGVSDKLSDAYTVRELYPFYGVYSGQSALQNKPETIRYLSNSVLDNCIVNNAETGETGGVYDLDRFEGQDPYEIFLSGSQAILTIDNPANTSSDRLIVFRDSFGSSLTPLLVEAYSQVVVVDIRYVSSRFLNRFITLTGEEDVLFLYSTLVLNSSSALK